MTARLMGSGLRMSRIPTATAVMQAILESFPHRPHNGVGLLFVERMTLSMTTICIEGGVIAALHLRSARHWPT